MIWAKFKNDPEQVLLKETRPCFVTFFAVVFNHFFLKKQGKWVVILFRLVDSETLFALIMSCLRQFFKLTKR